MFSTTTLPAFAPNYRDIGGDPIYYPNSELDISKERFSVEASNSDPFKIKRDILKARLSSAEKKHRELTQVREEQLALDRELEHMRAEDVRRHSLLQVLKYSQNESSISGIQKHKQNASDLANLKSKRVMANHNMNIIRDKILRLRKTHSQLESQLHQARSTEATNMQKLTRYESLVRENLDLKRRAVLAGAVLRNGI